MNERKIIMSGEEIVITLLLMVIVALIIYIISTVLRVQFLESALQRAHRDFINYALFSDQSEEMDNAEEFKNDFNEKWNKVCDSMKEFGNHV